MSHTEYRNGAIVEVDDSTGAAISTTALHHTDGYNKDVDIVLSASTSPVETGYTPVDCRELEATINMLNHYSELVFSAQTDYCKILYNRICSALSARIDDMEKRLACEAKD